MEEKTINIDGPVSINVLANHGGQLVILEISIIAQGNFHLALPVESAKELSRSVARAVEKIEPPKGLRS